MKGLINKGMQDMVETKFDTKTWEKVKSIAGCNEPFFAIISDYPDEMTISLIKAVSEVSGLPMETVMIEFGRFVVPNTLKENYKSYFSLAGSTPREFLLDMGKVHEHVTRSIMNATPPKFEFEELPDGKLRMHYDSSRGLCVVLKGLILGVGDYFKQELKVNEVACAHMGDNHCIMEVTFP